MIYSGIKWKMRNGKWKIGKVDSENVVPILLSRSFSAARKGHVFGAQSPTTPRPLCAVKRGLCSCFAWVATVSACWPWAFRHGLRPTTTADHAVIVATNMGFSVGNKPSVIVSGSDAKAHGSRRSAHRGYLLGVLAVLYSHPSPLPAILLRIRSLPETLPVALVNLALFKRSLAGS